MALERLTLAPVVLPSTGGDEDQNKAPRLPRWTRQELLVLIQGKRVAENRVRRGRAFGSQVEPKWSSVSSYCKRHGVNRGPVQCRKRWSNLAGDFKKIKEWESGIKEEAESFWVMRNDLRRERKLPGFFDREVYDILDGSVSVSVSGSATPTPTPTPEGLVLTLAPSAQPEEEEAVFDSGRTAAADDALFSDDPMAKADPIPISATEHESGVPPPSPAPATEKESGHEGRRKRKRDEEEEEEMSVEKQLIEAMERNSRLLSSQLEIQNTNSQLDREQRKDDANTLFSVLNKLADAMVRIADKL